MGIFDIITPAFFCPPQNNEKRLAVLKKNIKFVEVEISTFCNRRCFFCGNKDIDRRSANRYMDEDLYLSILQQLQEFQYTGKLAFHRYNEPLADPIIFTRLRQARTFLPEALLCIFTNGDYLDRDMFLHLEELGVREMEISAPYFDEGEVYSPEEARNRIEGRLAQIGLNLESKWVEHGDDHQQKIAKYGNLNISIQCFNRTQIASYRAGLVESVPKFRRISPCLKAFTYMAIDFNGSMMPCCNFRSDAPEHAEYILGDLNQQSLKDIYFSEKACAWRARLMPFNADLPKPCLYCIEDRIPATKENMAAAENSLQVSGALLAALEKNLRAAEAAGRKSNEDLAVAVQQQNSLNARLLASEQEKNAFKDKLQTTEKAVEGFQARLTLAEQAKKHTEDRLAAAEQAKKHTEDRLAASEQAKKHTEDRFAAAEQARKTVEERLLLLTQEKKILNERLAVSLADGEFQKRVIKRLVGTWWHRLGRTLGIVKKLREVLKIQSEMDSSECTIRRGQVDDRPAADLPPGVTLLTNFAELDAFVEECNKRKNTPWVTLKKEIFPKYRWSYEHFTKLFGSQQQTADPYSSEYAAWEMAFFEFLSGRPYKNHHEGARSELQDLPADYPHPWAAGGLVPNLESLRSGADFLEAIKPQRGDKVLEMGCGTGNIAALLEACGCDYYGIDASKHAVGVTQRRLFRLSAKDQVRVAYFHDISQFKQLFDIVIFEASFHHCEEPVRLLRLLYETTKPKARLIFYREPNRADYDRPWGLVRYDGESILRIRRDGELELGFRSDFFGQLLDHTGWTLKKNLQLSGKQIFEATKK